jgi:hypothetical protein
MSTPVTKQGIGGSIAPARSARPPQQQPALVRPLEPIGNPTFLLFTHPDLHRMETESAKADPWEALVASDVFDVIVIGAGPVGESAARRAVQGGLSAAVVERRWVGECNYCGCIPTARKPLSAPTAHGPRHGAQDPARLPTTSEIWLELLEAYGL